MATRMGVKEFRDNFTAIARDAKAPVVVTNHDKVIGYYTPAKSDPTAGIDWARFERRAAAARARLEARGIDVAAKLKRLGVEDDAPFDDAWTQGKPPIAKPRKSPRKP